MSLKSSMIPLAAALLVTVAPAMAQNYQNWDMNQQNQIQQSAASGMLNANQAQNLQARDAQIMAQQQAYMAQNGGSLTQGESRQIRSELSHVQNGLNRDVSRNTGLVNGVSSYMPVNYASNGLYRPYQNYSNYTNVLQQVPSQYHNNWGYRHQWSNNGWH